MSLVRFARSIGALALLALLAPGGAHAVVVENLEGLEDIYGRYAPGSDCQREPRITVDRTGITFEIAGKTEKVTSMEYAASYGGNFYEGIGKWVFPWGRDGDYPVLMSFHAGEKRGELVIEGHGAGYPGGPPLAPKHAALVKGSPYRPCR